MAIARMNGVVVVVVALCVGSPLDDLAGRLRARAGLLLHVVSRHGRCVGRGQRVGSSDPNDEVVVGGEEGYVIDIDMLLGVLSLR